MTCIIYDFETLSQDQYRGVVVSLALLQYDESRFIEKPYEYEELLSEVKMIKYDVEEQVKEFGRSISKDTLEWWKKLPPEVRKQLKPSSEDRSIRDTYDFFVENADIPNLKKVYTRGNTFDPMFLENIVRQFDQELPYGWWLVRDTRSLIEGLSWGTDLKNSFKIPELEEKFVHHDPRHDITLDVMRMQKLSRAILL